MSDPGLAVVVATRHRGAKIVPLLESVLAGDRDDFEMIVVDQSVDDETETAVRPFVVDERIRYERSNTVGTSRARNHGFALTSAPIVLITDDDCTVPPNWFSGMARPFHDDPRVGVVFCTVRAVPVDEPGHTPAIEFTENHLVTSASEAWKLGRSGLNLGAGMAIRRSTFDEVGGFDELLGPGTRFGACEDNDLSWRGLLAGWFTYRSADVVIMHDGFRDLDELRDLVVRDFLGVGGAIAKYLRTGRFAISRLMFSWIVRFGLIGPARALMSGHKPSGLRRPLMMVRGLFAGLRTPLDRASLTYRADSDG